MFLDSHFHTYIFSTENGKVYVEIEDNPTGGTFVSINQLETSSEITPEQKVEAECAAINSHKMYLDQVRSTKGGSLL